MPTGTNRQPRPADDRQRRAGNTDFVNAEEDIRKKIGHLGLTEVNYFMEVFVPGYELTLDRLVL
jgi:5'-deoxynucleotidase